MKKVLACLLIVLMLALPAACGESPDDIITFEVDISQYNDSLKYLIPNTLTDDMKEKGFISIETNEEGVIVNTIKRKDYEEYREILKQTRVDIFEGYNSPDGDKYSEYISEVQYNEDLTEITIICDKVGYDEGSFEYGSAYNEISNCFSGCVNNTAIYQVYNIHNKSGKWTVRLKDKISGEIFLEEVYPDSYNKY